MSGTTFAFSGENTNTFGPPLIGMFTRTGSNPPMTIASASTSMPGGGGTFFRFFHPISGPILPNISGANVVFGGQNSSGSTFGLYLATPFGLGAVATNATAIPNGTGNYTSFGIAPAISGANIAFFGAGSGGQQGIYCWSVGSVSLVADRTTSVPGGAGTFSSLLLTDVAISGDRVASRGSSGTRSGIYIDLTGCLTKVIATGDTLDGNTVDGGNSDQFAFDGNRIAVMVSFTNNTDGYTFTRCPNRPVYGSGCRRSARNADSQAAVNAIGLGIGKRGRKPPLCVSVLYPKEVTRQIVGRGLS